MLCKHNDCGWCYAPELSDTNAKQGQCNDYSKCPEYKTLRDGWNIECNMEPTVLAEQLKAERNDEYDISQHSAEEVAESTISKVETVERTDLRTAISETMAAINEQEDPQITGQLRWHLDQLLECERDKFKGGQHG